MEGEGVTPEQALAAWRADARQALQRADAALASRRTCRSCPLRTSGADSCAAGVAAAILSGGRVTGTTCDGTRVADLLT